ncbi:MAG: heparinase II/III family protein [Mucilaginibacter sp.]|uniref:heparinase II/III domain-containing protein n=1 Tax=Mucilaginibacter sp. TaxID=1882438 RepID=UPI003265D6B6
MSYRSFFVLVLCVYCTCLKANAQVTVPDNPVATLKKGHPRLLVSSLADFEQLKKRIPGNEFLIKAENTLRLKADKMLTEPLNKYTMIPSNYLLNTSRSVLDRSYTLSMMYRLTGKKKYADRLWLELDNAAKFPDWDIEHFLGTAEMDQAFAIAYDWLYDVWTDPQKQIIKTAIKDKALEGGLLYYQGKGPGFDWAKAEHNWNQVCNGSMIIGALAIADEEPQLADTLIKNAIKRLPAAMKHYGPDGAWFEGPTYLAFAMRYNVAAIACLESALGTDFGLSTIQGFSKTGSFVMAMSGATAQTFNYSDAPLRIVTMPEFLWLANKFNDPEIAAYQQKYTDHSTAVEMLWYSDKKLRKAAELPLDQYFRSAEVASLRSSWNDEKAWFVGFKAGENGVNHGHLDLGTFVLEKNAKRWVIDLGPDTYNLPGYFNGGKNKSVQRYSYYRLSTEGHNTLVVKVGQDANQNAAASTFIKKFKSDNNNSFGIMDLTEAYAPNGRSVKRGIAMIDKKQVLIQDEITTDKPLDLYWQIHTPAIITLSDDKRSAILKMGVDELKVEILKPATKAAFEIIDAIPILNEPLSKGNTPNEGIKRLVIHFKAIGNVAITVLFKEKNDNTVPVFQSLSAW